MKIEWIKKFWNDPVWSKVIAAGIITLSSVVIGFIGLIVLFFWQQLYPNHVKTFFEFALNYFSNSTNVNNWIIWLFGILFLALATIAFYFNFLPNLKKKNAEESTFSDDKNELPIFNFNNSASFFDTRLGKAFPGVRGLVWFDSPDEAIKRLQIMLGEPLVFKGSNNIKGINIINSRELPMWWFRGSSSGSIESFSILKQGYFQPKLVRLNIDEYIISKIAVYNSSSCYRNFVYVETIPSVPSGAYEISEEDIEQCVNDWGYYSEEFATIDGRIIKRTEYDDGAAVIKGKIVDASNAKLVTRYLSKYNFVITGQQSALNVLECQREQTQLFNSILQGNAKVEDLVKHVESINKTQIIKYG